MRTKPHHRCLNRKAALIWCLALCVAAPQTEAASRMIASGTSLDSVGNSFTFTQLDWQSASSFRQNGMLVRVKAGAGTFIKQETQLSHAYLSGEVLLGGQFWHGDTRFQLLAGGQIKQERQPLDEMTSGMKLDAQLLHLWPNGSFMQAGAVVSSLNKEWSVQLCAGIPAALLQLPASMKLGAELMVTGDENRTQMRLGAAAYDLRVGRLSVSISAGGVVSKEHPLGAYGQMYIATPF